jgi:eukaryotic-like serine/threonine-protein kinase
MHSQIKHLLEFGPFRLDPDQRVLLREEQPISLTPKAFDLLLILTERPGQLLIKDDLMKLLWPDTFVEESNLAQHVFQLRKALGEKAQDSAYIVTVPGRGYRFAQQVRTLPPAGSEPEEDLILAARSRSRVVVEERVTVAMPRMRSWSLIVSALAVVVALAVAAALYLYTHRTPKLTAKDTVVLADFANTTGDPVFDSALRQGLLAQLQQSPYLNLLSDSRISQTLALMTRPGDAKLTPEMAREVCQRTASSAVLDGSIAQVGSHYLLTLKATGCSNGEPFASAVAQASDKNHVLDALGRIASQMRHDLGESLPSVEKYDVAPEKVTTPSIEALHAFSLGRQVEAQNRGTEAVALYRQAISLDPNFVSAYEGLGIAYYNHDETSEAAQYIRKAYDLRERSSERERIGIEVTYYAIVLGNCEGAHKTLLLATQLYPREAPGFTNLGTMASCLGNYAEGLAAHQQAMKLAPGVAKNYSNLLIADLFAGRLNDAEAVAREAKARGLESSFLHENLYLVEFLKNDPEAMQREVRAVGDADDLILYYQSDTAAYHGHFAEARDLTRRAMGVTTKLGNKEIASAFQAAGALREALAGNRATAKREAMEALALSNERDVAAVSALALAMAGDSSQAARLTADLDKRFPEDTAMQHTLLPSIRSMIAIAEGDPKRAIQTLAPHAPYDLAQTAQLVSLVLYPIYLRGEAYLAEKNGAAAAVEFQKIIYHPGLAQNELIGALAHLGLARAYTASGNVAQARAEYQLFLELWKSADPEIPLFRQAKSESARIN